jgi:hypothetical protein
MVQSASDVQPSGTMQVRSRQTMPMKGQSSSLPQRKGGKHLFETHRHPPEHSASVMHAVR